MRRGRARHGLPDLESLLLLPLSWEGSAAAREGRRERPRLGGGGRRQAAPKPREAAGGAAGGPGAGARPPSSPALPSKLCALFPQTPERRPPTRAGAGRGGCSMPARAA